MRPNWMQRLFPNVQDATKKPQPEEMNQGDYHSGPEGYSANTAYPETQYGSRFDEEADWNEGER